jgi:hypothetical protein
MRLVRRGSRKPKRTIKKRKGLRFRMKVIPSIATSDFDWESVSMEKFLNMKVPYLAVNPKNYTVLLGEYPIIEGTGAVYQLNRDFSFSLVENYKPRQTPTSTQLFNRRLRVKDYEFTPADLFVHKFADIFNKQKWIQLGVQDTDFFNELFSDVPDIRISTKPNIIHLFIFLNAMPALFDFMEKEENEIEEELVSFFTRSGWNLDNFIDLYTVVPNVTSSKIKENYKNRQVQKRFSSILCFNNPSLGLKCPSVTELESHIRERFSGLIQSIKNLRTIFQTMQSIPDTENLGYIFLLNYWVFRVMNLEIIQNKLPANASQQIETLMMKYSIEDSTFKPDIIQIDNSNFVPQDSVGVFKGKSYPNCVENSIFKLFQVLIWDFDRRRYNPDLLEHNNPKLRIFLEELNVSNDKSHLGWNNLVSGIPNIQYNSSVNGKGYNIKSNRANVLTLLNDLTATTYPTIKEWVLKVTQKNNFLINKLSTKKIDEYEYDDEDDEYDEYDDEDDEYDDEVDENDDEISITIKSIYHIGVHPGHTVFYMKLDESNNEQFINNLSKIALVAINEFGFSNTANSIIIDSIYKRSDFRLRYVRNLVNMTTDDNVIIKIKHPDDLFEIKKYRDLTSILTYSNIPIPIGFIPDDTTDLNYSNYFNKPIGKGVLPEGLQTLTLGENFINPIDKEVLPAGLQTLIFGNKFDQIIDKGVLPEGLQNLKFGSLFDQVLDKGVLPKGLKNLEFGSFFDRPIEQDVLPEGLRTLTFGSNFNIRLQPRSLPSNLQSLTFGTKFNKPISKGVFPEGLKILKFGSYFNQPIDQEVLPKRLQVLTFDLDFNQPLDQGVLPEGLQTLTFGNLFNRPLDQGVLPEGLQTLTFGSYFNQIIGEGVLPEGLQTLTFGTKFNKNISKGSLPKGLQTLDLGENFNQIIGEGVLPAGLQSLTFSSQFNQPINKGVLPVGLRSLTFGSYFDQPIKEGVLPAELHDLEFVSYFNQAIAKGVLPVGLQNLKFGWRFNQVIVKGVLPEGLQTLSFKNTYKHLIDQDVLPASLKKLTIGDRIVIKR